MKKEQKYLSVLRKLVWIVFGFGLVALSISAASHKQGTYISGLDVHIQLLEQGNNLITKDDVIKEINDAFGSVENLRIEEVDAGMIEDALEHNPFMSKVNVYVDAHNVMNVSLAQREPLVRVMALNNEDYYLDKEGVKIPVSSHYTAHVPIAVGKIKALATEKVTELDEFHYSLLQVSNAIHKDQFLRALIDQFYQNENGDLVMIPNMGAKRIVIGDESDIADKLDRLKIFYKKGIPTYGWNTYKQIDLRFRGQVVCKKI